MEASGKSLVEAKETALDLLGVAEDDAEFVILSEPKAGLFGRMRGEARVQARVRPVAPPPKRGRRQRPERRRDGADRPPKSGTSKRGGQDRGEEGDATRTKGGDATEDETVEAVASEGKGRAGGGAGGGEAAGTSRRRGRGGTPQGSPTGGRSQQGKTGAGGTSAESEGNVEETLTLEQQGESAQEFLAGLVKEFGLQADVTYRKIDEDTVEVSASGDDLGLLVGPRGATLAAVQDLARTFVQRQSENRTDRILVDVGGYREKRSAALRRFAEGIVAEVRESGTERALEPMSSADRKVVHDAVNELDGVRTRSEGDEPSRYIVIEPAD